MSSSTVQLTSNDYPTGVFMSVFTGNEAFLSDHIIQGKKILPGMAYLEMSRAAVVLSSNISDKQMVVLSESIFIQPLIVTQMCSVEVKVLPGASGEFGIEVSTAQGVHFQTNAHIQDKHTHTAQISSPAHLESKILQQSNNHSAPSKEQIYTSFKKLGIDYGPSHQGIETVKIGKDCALVSLFLSGSSNKAMDLNPGMLDSVIQSCVVLNNFNEGISVPFAVKHCKIFGPLTDKVTAYLFKTDQAIDFTIADDNGVVQVILNGYFARELNLSTDQGQLVYYTPVWQHQSATSKDEQDCQNSSIICEQTSYSNLVKTVFTTAQTLIQAKTDHHTIDVSVPIDKPSWLGIIAALKTISLEYPKITYRLRVADRYLKLNYLATDMSNTDSYCWPDNKTILITGGLGGLGKLFVQDIVQTSKGCTVILIGRGELNSEKKSFLKNMENVATNVIYEQCDLTELAAVNTLITKYSHINGVIHGSGIIKDNYIAKKTLDEIDQVLKPKVTGLEYLDQATANIKLDYFITLSSIVGTLGNTAQIDYAAANAYMDAYIHNRADLVKKQQRYGKSISINWPLWESDGMQVDQQTKQNLLHVFKIKPLPAETGLTALKKIIASEQTQVLVLFGNKKAISNMLDQSTTDSQPIQQKTLNVQTDKLNRAILQEVIIQTAEQLKLAPDQLDEESDWAEFGFDSILLSSLINAFNTQFDLELMPTVLFEATNIQQFTHYLCEHYPQQMAEKLSLITEKKITEKKPNTTTTQPKQDEQKISSFAQAFKKTYKTSVVYREEDIAIVGMSCKTAGAHNLEEFWQLLVEEKDMISEIPLDRWDWQDQPDSVKWGSFIDGVAEFDALFFGISPAEAAYMAPEQRLMMQSVWECLENAGCGGETSKATDTGIFIGCGSSDYTSMLNEMPIEGYSATGMVSSVGPNRISYMMDWHGPSEPIETACSSSLVAIHRAVEAIRHGHCSQAIAGGVNLLLSPKLYISFTKAGMLSKDGRCKTFSDNANGYVRGEGVGILMLKPLKDAIRDGNIIHAVIKGTAENHGGRSNSLTAPNPTSQAAVIKRAISDADIDFSRITYIECHGTGTELGDPIEIEGLKTVATELCNNQNNTQTCKLGSIKSNIGHLEMAAGAIGLIKVVLQMQHKKISKSLHCNTINPYIDLTGTPYEIAQHASDWQVAAGQTRVAGVSSFGFGGVNSHVILEEFQAPAPSQNEHQDNTDQQTQLLLISARNEQCLNDYVALYKNFIKTLPNSSAHLKQLAYTLQLGRSQMQERVAFIVTSIEEWAEQLNVFLQNQGKINNRCIYRGSVKTNGSSKFDIDDTQAGKQYVKQLIASNELEKLAELWIKGAKIDWQTLHM